VPGIFSGEERLLELTHDYIHPTPHGGRCRVRIFEDRTELPVIVCTELTDNPGMSITNTAEQIAAEVLENHPHVFDPFALASIAGLSYDKPFVWVEHYEAGARGTPSDPATFDLVEFSHYEVRGELRAGQWAKEIGSPSWKPLNRASVEALIGGPI
jgi:hypothetical protein